MVVHLYNNALMHRRKTKALFDTFNHWNVPPYNDYRIVIQTVVDATIRVCGVGYTVFAAAGMKKNSCPCVCVCLLFLLFRLFVFYA